MKCEPKVKLISECYIKPNHKLIDETSKIPYNLSPMDLILLCSGYMQKGLLYTKSCDQTIEIFLDKFKQSLYVSLHHFYPLAGRFATQIFPDEHACCIFLDCIEGPGVRFIHAFLDSNVSDVFLTKDKHPAVKFFFDMGQKAINYDGHTNALVSVQVTELLDGIFIGFSVNHSICDGTSLLHFITTLSETFNSINENSNVGETYAISSKPIFKPFSPKGYGPILKLPYVESNEFISRYDRGLLREKVFHFSQSSILNLKANANANASKLMGSHKPEVSSFQALSSLIWRAITRARKLDPEMETSVSLTMNSRPRLRPPISQEHFGNYFSWGKAKCKVGELVNKDLGWGALLVHQCVKCKDDKSILEFLRKYCEAPFVAQPGNESVIYGPNFVNIVGSPRFDLYGTEFGMGKPVAINSGFARKIDGRVAANQGCHGPGSVELDVSLAPSIMSALELDEEFMSFVSLID